MNIAKNLRALILMKIWEQLLLSFLLLTANISSKGLIPALSSIGLLQRFSSMFEEFSLGCLAVASSLRKISRNGRSLSFVVPLVVTRCHSLSFVVTRCTTRCHSLYHSLSFVVTHCHSLSIVLLLVVTRCHSMYYSPVFL